MFFFLLLACYQVHGFFPNEEQRVAHVSLEKWDDLEHLSCTLAQYKALFAKEAKECRVQNRWLSKQRMQEQCIKNDEFRYVFVKLPELDETFSLEELLDLLKVEADQGAAVRYFLSPEPFLSAFLGKAAPLEQGKIYLTLCDSSACALSFIDLDPNLFNIRVILERLYMVNADDEKMPYLQDVHTLIANCEDLSLLYDVENIFRDADAGVPNLGVVLSESALTDALLFMDPAVYPKIKTVLTKHTPGFQDNDVNWKARLSYMRGVQRTLSSHCQNARFFYTVTQDEKDWMM